MSLRKKQRFWFDSVLLALCRRILDYSLDSSKIRTQDMTSAITKVSSNVAGRLLAWDFIRENFNKIIKKYVHKAAIGAYRRITFGSQLGRWKAVRKRDSWHFACLPLRQSEGRRCFN